MLRLTNLCFNSSSADFADFEPEVQVLLYSESKFIGSLSKTKSFWVWATSKFCECSILFRNRITIVFEAKDIRYENVVFVKGKKVGEGGGGGSGTIGRDGSWSTVGLTTLFLIRFSEKNWQFRYLLGLTTIWAYQWVWNDLELSCTNGRQKGWFVSLFNFSIFLFSLLVVFC